MFEIFEHTADLGLRVKAPDLDRLFAAAGRGLSSILVENSETIQPRQTDTINLHARSIEDLFFDWLAELLYRFDARHMIFSKFEVKVNGTGPASLHAEIVGEPVDPQRHQLAHEVKAITYHALSVRQTAEGWVGQVIVDI